MLRQVAAASFVVIAAMMLITVPAADSAAADSKEKKFEAKCPVSGSKAKEDQCCEYKDGQVYFCCGKCKAAFAKDSKKHAVKANAQLVSTGQYVQKKCPLTGGPMKKKLDVAGIKVQFCCDNCRKKARNASDDEALALIFSEDAFKKGFRKKKEKSASAN